MHISRSSNFSAELDKVKAFYEGLEKVDNTYKGTIVPIQEKITGFSCSSWTDNVGDQMLTLVKGIKESEIVTLDDNQTIGGFKQLVDNTVALKDALGNCVTCAIQIRNDEATMASEARKKKKDEGYSSLYYSAKNDKEATEKALDGHIATANSLIAKYPNIHFNGAGYQIDASSGGDSDQGGSNIPGEGDTFVIKDVYTNNGYNRSHMIVDPVTGNWIIIDQSHYATLYVNNGDDTVTIVQLGDCYGEDCVEIFNYLKTNGNDADSLATSLDERSFANGDRPSATWLNGDISEAVTYDVPATVTYEQGPNGEPIPVVSFDSDVETGDYTVDSNTVAQAYLNGETGENDGTPRSYQELLNGS